MTRSSLSTTKNLDWGIEDTGSMPKSKTLKRSNAENSMASQE